MEDFTNHTHKPSSLTNLSQDIIKKWSEINTKYNKIFETARPLFKQMKPLV